MKVDVLLGLQWGDEGKGKIVDVLTPQYDVVARFQGGPNAGHSLEFNNIKHVLHSIPSGIFHDGQLNVIGNGVVIDPFIFKQEIDDLKKIDVDIRENLLISKKAHLILPTHKLLDAANEKAKGKTKIGSTLKGIGPTYMDKTGRNGVRVGDVLAPDFMDRYKALVSKHIQILDQMGFEYDVKALEEDWFKGIEVLRSFNIVESEKIINDLLNEGKTVLAEGAQGTLLDIDFGSYPFVTSSNTISSGACSGLGIAPNKVKEIYGIFKAYCTRVGSGPFPTELFDDTGKELQEKGNEFGATTGRARRCGWLDLPALKYAIMINGVTSLIMTKADVLYGFSEINVCTAYKRNGEELDYLPYEIDEQLQPIYTSFKAWGDDITGARSADELPDELKAYVAFIEKEVGVPVNFISVGPDREQIIER